MNRKPAVISDHKFTYIFIGACVLISLALNLSARFLEGFAQWYAVNIYPVFPAVVGRAFSGWDFSFFEAGMILFAIMSCLLLLKGFWTLLTQSSQKKAFSSGMRIFLSVAAGLMLFYTLSCSVNYHRDGIGTVLQLPREEASKEKLEKLCAILSEELTALTKDPEWNVSLQTLNDMDYIETEAVSAMKQLAKRDPSFAGYYPNPKPIYFSAILSGFGIEGFFSPFTMEANYNGDMTPFLAPYTISHELAHLKGFMREDDAGFIAYLACRNSPSKIFQYSGTFHALTFSLAALKSEIGGLEFNKIYQELPESVRNQLRYINEHSRDTEPSYLSISRTVNNIYLKANAQTQGTKSYIRMVDLLIADYADRISPENML